MINWSNSMHNILVTNIGFGQASPESLIKLKSIANIFLNEKGIRYTEELFLQNIANMYAIVAGTEKISRSVIEAAKDLKLIVRIGAGVDNIDLDYANTKGISISYTPDAPAQAIPEFALSLMLSLIKNLSIVDKKMHQGEWHRPMGSMLSSLKIGIIGAGKIGSRLIELIKKISPQTEVYYYDPHVRDLKSAIKRDIDFIFSQSDIISIHIPLNEMTKGFINKTLLSSMKKGSYIINTARGSIVDEDALYQLLECKHLAGAAIDVFGIEPYYGNLTKLDNCLLTSHIGSLTKEVRSIMEMQAVEDIIRFINNEPLLRRYKIGI